MKYLITTAAILLSAIVAILTWEHPLAQLLLNPLAGYSGVNAIAVLTLALFAGCIVGMIVEAVRK